VKRIALTVTTDLSYDQRMQRIAHALSASGYEVWLIGRQLSYSPPLPPTPFRQVRLRCHYHKGKKFYIEYNWRLWRFLSCKSWHCIAAADLDTLLPAYWVTRAQCIPLVFDAHEHFVEVPELVRRPWIRWLWDQMGKRLIPKAQLAYTVGPALAQILHQHYGRPFEVVRNVPELDTHGLVRSAQLHPPYVILYQGALNEGRGLETAIDAMALLPPEFELWLVGEGDLSTALRQRAAQSIARQRIRFLGKRTPVQLRQLTPRAWVGLNLLENKGISYYYSLANKAFDYLHAGVPAVHMDFPEYRHLVQQWGIGILLEQLDKHVLSQQLQLLAHQPERWQQLRANCLTARQHLHWQKEATRLRHIFAHLWQHTYR